jgi:hypothetical protein
MYQTGYHATGYYETDYYFREIIIVIVDSTGSGIGIRHHPSRPVHRRYEEYNALQIQQLEEDEFVLTIIINAVTGKLL